VLGIETMDTVLSLIDDYGLYVYLLLFGYCALKSGALPLFGGFAAQTGALDLSLVAIATFAGGYLGDEARFLAARRYGTGFLATKPRLAALMKSANTLLDRYGTTYMFLYRYPKGMRTIGALPVGLTNIRWQTFTVLNAASALLWAGLLIGAGYLFGETVEQAVEESWGLWSVGLLVLFLGATALVCWRLSRREDKLLGS
jgi:membrane protein DedA with SNARE-associated domain